MTQCGWWTRIQTTTLTFARMRTFLFQSRFHRQYSELRSSSHEHENDCNCIHTSPFTESLDYLPHLTATDHIISRWIQCVDWRFCAWPASLWLDHWVVSRCYMLATRYLDKPLNLGHTKTAWGQHKKQKRHFAYGQVRPNDARFRSQNLSPMLALRLKMLIPKLISMDEGAGRVMWTCQTPKSHCHTKPRQRYCHHSIAFGHSCQQPLSGPLPPTSLICLPYRILEPPHSQ